MVMLHVISTVAGQGDKDGGGTEEDCFEVTFGT